MKHIFLFFSLGAVLLFGSCATTNYISLDVLTPATLTISAKSGGQNVVIVDNASDWNALAEESDGIVPSVLDSTKADMLYSLVKFMNEEQYFNNVDIYPYKTFDAPQPNSGSVRLFTKKEVANICEESNADILISLDEFLIAGATIEYAGGHYNILELKIGLVMRAYSSVTGKMTLPMIIHTDSLYSPGIHYTKGKKNDEIEEVIKRLTLVTADKLTSKFTPHWGREERCYYSDGTNQMKEASKFVAQNKWKEAATIWGELFKVEVNDAKKAKLASNIALANEGLDDLPNALIWIDQAYDLAPSKSDSEYLMQIVLYKGVLKNRVQNMPKLKEQYSDN